ncbi:MAG: amidohydrolase, partial [Myxococcota bacterium]
MRTVLPQLWLASLCPACGAPPAPPPPTVVFSAPAVRTGGSAELQPAQLAVQADKFVAAPETITGEPIEADLITAGFIDAHAHPSGLGRRLDEIDLVGVATYAEALSLIADRAPKTGWVLGRGWDQNDWSDAPNGGWPLAADLDRLFPDRPVALRRVDGHATWANSAALKQAGLTASTPDPIGGRLVRAVSGAPSGVLIDTASDALTVPKPSVETVERWLLAAQAEMIASGLVGVHDMGIDDTTLAAYRALHTSGRLKVRVFAYLSPDSDAAQTLLREGPSWGSHLSIVGIKAYADGALGSRGAHLSSPYHDEPGTRGLAITPKAELQTLATRCLRVRAQLAIHAIGDQAVTDVLDAFEGARRSVPEADDVPLRLEHAQIVRPADRPRFASLGVVASMQPTHATSDMPWAPERLGEERVSWGYAWRSLTDAGAVVPLGSDFPVEAADPALGLWSATRRADLQGKPEGGWGGEEALSLIQAIDGFTTHTWSALGQPAPTLAPGQTADLTLW